MEGAELDRVEPGEPVGPWAIVQLTVDDELVDVNDPAQQEDGQQFVEVEHDFVALLIVHQEGARHEVVRAGDEQHQLNQQRNVLICCWVLLLLLLLQPLNSRLRLKPRSHHCHHCNQSYRLPALRGRKTWNEVVVHHEWKKYTDER